MGQLESKQGAYLEARAYFEVGIRRDPHYASLYHEAAMFEARLGNLEVRIEALGSQYLMYFDLSAAYER